MTVRRLLLLRHGQTEHNAGNRMQGQLDTELSALGRDQAKQAAAILAERRPAAVVSSDLRRALDTATVIAESAGTRVRTDSRLRETHLGEWQGLTHAEVDADYPGARARWREDSTWAPPGGESRTEVARRALPVVRELVDELPEWGETPVLIVAHGGLIAALTAALLDLPVDRWPALGGLGNTGWAELSAPTQPTGRPWRLEVWNASPQVAGDVF